MGTTDNEKAEEGEGQTESTLSDSRGTATQHLCWRCKYEHTLFLRVMMFIVLFQVFPLCFCPEVALCS